MDKSNYQNRLNFYSIVEACREFLPAIREEYRARWFDLADIRRPDDVHPSTSVNFQEVLEGHRVRFVNQEGHYDYASFGEFVFRSMGVMMLITRDVSYTSWHEPDFLCDTLWSTVPVFYAGIETGVRDDCGHMIHTGDILRCRRDSDGDASYVGMVNYMFDSRIPSITMDNVDLFLNECCSLHIEGSIFTEFNANQLQIYNIDDFTRYAGDFMYGRYLNYTEEDWQRFRKKPEVTGIRKPKLKGNCMVYLPKPKEFPLKEGDKLICFCASHPEREESGGLLWRVYNDYGNIAGDYKSVAITLDLENPDYEQLHKDIIELLIEIHNNPDTRYVLLDMKEAIGNNKVYREIAECFRPAGIFLVRNLVMPFEIGLP